MKFISCLYVFAVTRCLIAAVFFISDLVLSALLVNPKRSICLHASFPLGKDMANFYMKMLIWPIRWFDQTLIWR